MSAPLLIRDAARPLATLSLHLETGILDDPTGQEGLSFLTAMMLMRGAGDLDHEGILETLDLLGSTLGVDPSRAHTGITGDALTRNLDLFEELVAKVVAEPRFEPEELAKLKREVQADLAQLRDHDPSLGQRFFVRSLYGDHPYGRPLKGTASSIERVGPGDVRAFWERCYHRGGVQVGAAGDIDLERVEAFVRATAGRLPGEGPPRHPAPRPASPEGWNLTLVDKPERSQTQIFCGQLTPDAHHPDWLPLFLGNVVFGGTFTARLSHEIREKRGWSYGAYSYLHADQTLGTFTMRFYPQTEDTPAALALAADLFESWATAGITEEELEAARNHVVRSHPMSLETAERELHERLGARLIGRPDSWTDAFPGEVAALTLDEVNAALGRHLDPTRMTVTVVCTAPELEGELGQWGRTGDLQVVDHRSVAE